MILNLTQHIATNEQLAQGVVEPQDKAAVQRALTFDRIPTPSVLRNRADILGIVARMSGCKSAMIGGASYLMPILERELLSVGIRPLYSFTERRAIEKTLPDGTVEKTSVFQHVGFVGTEYAEV